MPLTAYLKIDGIPGESQVVEHEDEIDIFDMRWGLEQRGASQVGRGRARARADVGPLVVRKFYDAASPYLAQAVQQGRSFPEMVLAVRKDSGDAHLDYLVITMENVLITAYEVASDPDDLAETRLSEDVALDFEKVTLRYTRQDPDGSAGEVHEVTLRA